MALTVTKITKYTASDGTIFIGGDNKDKALQYEDAIQCHADEFDFIKQVLTIVGQEGRLNDTDRELFIKGNLDLKDIQKDVIDDLFECASCSSELQDLDDMLYMIEDVIHSFGGINAVRALYKLQQERKKKRR